MKKILVLMCVLFFGINCFADEIYLFKGTAVKNNFKQKAKKSKSVINLPETKQYTLITNYNDSNQYNTLTANTALTSASAAVGIIAAASTISGSGDPYVIQIRDKQYVLVKYKTKGKWTSKDLFGIEDDKNARFNSLVKLDSDRNGKVSAEEIRKEGLRLVQADLNGTLLVKHRQNDFNLKDFDYIDLNSLARNANSEETGIFGHFNVYLKLPEQRIAVGYVTYDKKDDLNIMF